MLNVWSGRISQATVWPRTGKNGSQQVFRISLTKPAHFVANHFWDLIF